MPVDFSSLLAETLSNRRYEVEDTSPIEGASGASYPVSMVAVRDGQRFLVDALASRPVRDEDVDAVASIVTDTGLDGAIVLALRGTEATQAHDSVEVWDRTTVEQAVGALVVDGHLDEVGHADDIGPSPVDTDPATGPTAEADEEPTREPAPDPAATGPVTDTASSQPDPTPQTTDPGSEPSSDRSPTADPDPAPEPEPEPQTATADEGTTDPLDEDIDHGEFVDPEDMLERAEELMQEGAVDDGDAELIVDEDPDPEPQPDPSPNAGNQAPAEPQPEPETEAEPAQGKPNGASSTAPEEPASDGSDAEILEDDTGSAQPRPQPDGEGPQPETATTARDPDRRQPSEDTASPSPETDASPAAAAGPAGDAEAFVSGAAIEPQIDEAEARRTAQEAVFEAHEARLELLPFRVYRYRAQLEGDGHARGGGPRVGVHAVRRRRPRPPRRPRRRDRSPPRALPGLAARQGHRASRSRAPARHAGTPRGAAPRVQRVRRHRARAART
jgi:hypothetical protein